MRLSKKADNSRHPLLQQQKSGKILALLISSNRGLAGSYNSDIFKKTLRFIDENGLENIEFITMGEKGKKFLQKISANIIADFALGQEIRFTMTSPVALIAQKGFEKKQYRRFVSLHTHFESAGRHGATVFQILPLDTSHIEGESAEQAIATKTDFEFEPDQTRVFDKIILQTLRALTYQVILESEAAEHASRMIAMKNATDAGSDLKNDFEFTFNQLRQGSITAELSEISAGAIAQE